jgi:hypothetical protein
MFPVGALHRDILSAIAAAKYFPPGLTTGSLPLARSIVQIAPASGTFHAESSD